MARKDPQNGPSNQVTGTTVQNVLHDARNVNFDAETSWKPFQEKHRVRLSKSPDDGGNPSETLEDEVLHALARSKQDGNEAAMTPLHLAITRQNHTFLGLILEHSKDAKVLLEQQTDVHETCLHLAIFKGSPFTETIISMIQQGSAFKHSMDSGTKIARYDVSTTTHGTDIFTVQCERKNFENMTPLHVAVSMVQEDLDNTISDYTYEVPITGKPLSAASGIKKEFEKYPKLMSGSRRASLVDNTDKALPIGTLSRQGTFKDDQEAKLCTEGKARSRVFDLRHIVEKLVEAKPRVLIDYQDNDDETPFQARLSYLLSKSQQYNGEQDGNSEKRSTLNGMDDEESKRHKIIENDEILTFLRKYIIENFDRKDARKALYKVGDERLIEFDLSGLPYPKIDTDFLNGLGKVLRFEGLLKYIALPRLVVDNDEDQGDHPSKLKGRGIQYMNSIFHWLKRRHVKSVLKVTVIDNVEPSHSDETIEECLKGLDVRIWNWYKMDLCCDVIFQSAPEVKDVTLYSSGNNATLMGWSSPEGIPKLKTLDRLQVYVQEGLDSTERLKRNMEIFKTQLKRYNEKLAFTWDIHRPDLNGNSVFVDRSTEKRPESKWMKTMKEFGEFLSRIKLAPTKSSAISPIKIAIIDDGIDMTLDLFANKVHGGESFYGLGDLSGHQGVYYVPSGPHGTLMARLICEVCPVVKLYIAQLEVLPGHDGRRSFTEESAAEAIIWAKNQGVDIISMTRDRIVMFCSSIDEGATAIDHTYPGRNKNCIKIGACTGTGTKLSWVSDAHSDFLVPGEANHLTLDSELWNQHHIGSFGSSVSTALAAGLAGVLLYCDRLIETPKESIDSTDTNAMPDALGKVKSSKAVDYLRSQGLMTEAFQRLSKGTEKFLQIWDYLRPEDIETLIWNEQSHPDETNQTKSKIQDFMKQLKHN
ncbi:hypothetical protein MKX08_003347 [Trichoderma sp. CBMAI-0020]|nr:hypothetical protein MKX08_003347 [Trichoderma sp. CBMAI-0020]